MAKFVAFLFGFLIFTTFNVENASAISVSNYGNDALSDVRSNYGTTGGITGQTGTNVQQNLIFTMPYSYTVNNLRLQMAEESFRANSIIHFNIAYTTRQANGTIQNNYVSLKYFGLHLAGGVTILHDSCFEAPYEVAMTGHTFECSYTAFVPYSSNYIASSLNTRIVGPNDTNITQSDYQTQLIITPISWITVNPNALTSEDRAWLESVLPDSTTVGEVEQALDNARESEKEEYEDQADENEQTANDESSAAQGSATSLLAVVGQFIGVLTSAQPTNCNLNGNLIPHLPLGQLNLCQNSPPAAITILGSLLLIAFVVPLAYHTVKRMLALIGSFQS